MIYHWQQFEIRTTDIVAVCFAQVDVQVRFVLDRCRFGGHGGGVQLCSITISLLMLEIASSSLTFSSEHVLRHWHIVKHRHIAMEVTISASEVHSRSSNHVLIGELI